MIESIGDWLQTSGIKVLIIILVAVFLERSARTIITRVVRSTMNPDNYVSEREERLRQQTVIGLVSTLSRVAIALVALMIILSELAIDIGPLLAGAGVIGFALGFGAQSLIKDFIAGIYIVLENQYRIGDVVELNGVSGQVKKLTTRITVIRDLDGNVHYIPNGTIAMATNMTMEYAKINMNILVAYESNIDKVKSVINTVGQDLANDEEWKEFITEAPYFARVQDLGESGIVIKIFGKTQAAEQWGVEGELRKRIIEAFAKNKVVIPYPQLTLHETPKTKK